MANTYTQFYVQIVFTVKGRANLISSKYKEDIQKYMTGIIQNRNHKLLAINVMPDHVHIFIGYNPTQLLPDLVRDIKSVSSKFINEKCWLPGKFEWQNGYEAFSYSGSDISSVIKYIENQELHHHKNSFKDEYMELLRNYDIEYNEIYLFDWIDD